MTQPHEVSRHEYLTPAQVCVLLKISARTLYRYQDGGFITPVLLPSGHRRFRRIDVDRLVTEVGP